ncbi:MAG TPA: nucleoside phosphorylase [Mobilitalea sp.]|nr:nucleoside phosphorylase [Mobilitalea sp.]
MSDLQPHIRLSREESARYALLPGDPGRIDHIKTFLTDVKELAYNRELRSISGYYKGMKVLAVSTGMGGASTGIAVEELHNIGVEYMIRIGSCGALDSTMRLGDLLIVNGAARDEGTSKAYIESIYPAIPDTGLLMKVIQAAKECKAPYLIGKARSHDSFYTDREEEIDRYWSGKGIAGADMETAALFVIGSLRGVKTASILNTVVEYEGELTKEINQYVDGETSVKQGEHNEILVALEAFLKDENMIQVQKVSCDQNSYHM